jgi:hypothetical protein
MLFNWLVTKKKKHVQNKICEKCEEIGFSKGGHVKGEWERRIFSLQFSDFVTEEIGDA